MAQAIRLLGEQDPAELHGTLLIAECQTAGIGRRGRSWESVEGLNLLFSVVWSTPALHKGVGQDALLHLIQLNVALPTSIAIACERSGVPEARVKWPNDVWTAGGKLAGALVDYNGASAAVLGAGVNVNQVAFGSEGLVQPTSMRQLCGQELRRESVLATICNALEELMLGSMDSVLKAYGERDLLRGRSIRVHHASREENDPRDYDAKALGVTSEGYLIVERLDGGGQRTLSGEEVSITPAGVAGQQ